VLKDGINLTRNYLIIMSTTPFGNSTPMGIQEKDIEYPLENVQKLFALALENVLL
jgi:hypothetical protein